MSIPKQEIRSALRRLHSLTLTAEYRNEASLSICRQIEQTALWQQAHRIGLFEALPDEPSMQMLLTHQGEKELFIPRVEGAETMDFYPYRVDQVREGGAFGITEPTQAMEEAVDPASLDLIIVPGGAFTPQGVRLGRGKGYYDRYLQRACHARLIGVTFHFRLLASLPAEEWDFLMNLVITNKT